MTMEYFMPSDVARLVLGYLKDHKYMKSYMCFLEECSLLQEFYMLFKAGRQPQITFPNFSLVLIIDEWGRYKHHCTCKLGNNNRGHHTVMTHNNDCQSEEITDNMLVGDNDIYERTTRGSACSSPVKRAGAIDAAAKVLDLPLKTVHSAVPDKSEILEQSQKLSSGEHSATESPHRREVCKQDSLSYISLNKWPLSNDRVRKLCGRENFNDCVDHKINNDFSVDTETVQISKENVKNHTDIDRTTDRKHGIELLENSSESESDTFADSVKANVEYPLTKLVEDIGKNKEILVSCSNKESLAEIKSNEQSSRNDQIAMKQNEDESHRTNVDNSLVMSHMSETLDCSNQIISLPNEISNRTDTVSSWIKNNDAQDQESKKITENITDTRQQSADNLKVHEENIVSTCMSITLMSDESVESRKSAVSQTKDNIIFLRLTPSKTPSCILSASGPDPALPEYQLNKTDSLLIKSPRRKKPKTPKKRTIILCDDTLTSLPDLPERNCENPLFQQILNDTRLHMKLAETCNLVSGQFKLNSCSSNKDKELHSKSGVSNHSDDMETVTASRSLEVFCDMDTNFTTELNMDLSDPVFEPFFKLFGTDGESFNVINENLRKENLKTAQLEADLEELEKSIHEEFQLNQLANSNKDEGYVTNFNSPRHQICITEPRTNQCAPPHVAVGDSGHPVVQVSVQQSNEVGSLLSTAVSNSLHQNKDNLIKTTASLTVQAVSPAGIPYSQDNLPMNDQLHVQPSSMHGTYHCGNVLMSQSYPNTPNRDLFHRDDHDSGTPVQDVCLTHSQSGSDPVYPIHHSSPINKLHSATLSGNFPAHLSPLVQANFNPHSAQLIKSSSHASLISRKDLLIPNNQEEANRLTNTNQNCVLFNNEQIIKQGTKLTEHDTLLHSTLNEHVATSTPVVFDIHTSLFSGQTSSSGHTYEERANHLKIIHDAIDLIQSSPEVSYNDNYYNDMPCDLQRTFSTIGNTMGCLSVTGNVDDNNCEPMTKSMKSTTKKDSGRRKKTDMKISDSVRYQYTTLKHLLSQPTPSTVPLPLQRRMILDPSSTKSPEKVGSADLAEHSQSITILSPSGTTKLNVPFLGFHENTDQVTHLEGGILENQYSVLPNNRNASSFFHSIKLGNVSKNANELKEQNCDHRKTKDTPQTGEKRPPRKRKTQPDKKISEDKVSHYCDNVGEKTYSDTPIGLKGNVLNRAFVRTLDFGPEAEDPSTAHYRKIYPKIPSAENTQVIILHTNQLWNNNSCQSQAGSRITIIQNSGNPDIHVERKVTERCESDKKTDFAVTSTNLRNDNETANISSGEIPVIGKPIEDKIKNKPSDAVNRYAKLNTSQTDVVRSQEKMVVCCDNRSNINKIIEKESECAKVKAVKNVMKTPSKRTSKVKEKKLQVKIVKKTSGKNVRSSAKQKAINSFFKGTDIRDCKKESPKSRTVYSDSDSSDDIPLSVLKSKFTPSKLQRHLDAVTDNESCTPESTQNAWNDNSNDVCTPSKVQLLEKVGLTPKKLLMENNEFKSPSRVNSLDVLANIQNSDLSTKRESSTPNRQRSSQNYENQKYTPPKRSPAIKLLASPSKDENDIADMVVNVTERRVNSMIKLLNKNNPNVLPIRKKNTSDIGLKRKNINNALKDLKTISKIKQAGNAALYEIQKEEKLPEQSENDVRDRNKTEPNLSTNESNERLLMKSHHEVNSRGSRAHDKNIQTRVDNRDDNKNQTSMSDRENVIESGDIEHNRQNRNKIFEILCENQHQYMNKEVANQHQSGSNAAEIVDGNKSRMISVESLKKNECISTLSAEIKQNSPIQSLAESKEICTIGIHMDKNKVEHSGKLMYSKEKRKFIREKNIIGDVSVNKTNDHQCSTKEQENKTTIVHPSDTEFKFESNNNEMHTSSYEQDVCLENIVCEPRHPNSGCVTNQAQTETPIKQSSIVYTSDNYYIPVLMHAHNDEHRNPVDDSSNYSPGNKMMKLCADENVVSEKDRCPLGVKSVASSEELTKVRKISAKEADGTCLLSVCSSLNPVKRKKKHKKHKHHHNDKEEQCKHHHHHHHLHHHHHKRKRKCQDESTDVDGDSRECKRRKTKDVTKLPLAAFNVEEGLSNLYKEKPVSAGVIPTINQ